MADIVDDSKKAPPSNSLPEPQAMTTDARPHLEPHPAHGADKVANEEPSSAENAPAESRFKNISKYGSVAFDAAAAGFSVAASRLSDSLPIKVTATLSGSLWTSAAFFREWDNFPRSKVVSSANFLGGAAGVLATAAPHLAGENLKETAYASAGAWVVNGAANLVRAIGKSDATIANRVLTGASGLANAAGAALSAASVNAAAENKSDDAVKLATASGAIWLAGSAAEVAAAWADRRRSKLLDSERLPVIEATGPVSHAFEHRAEDVDTDPGESSKAPAEISPHGLRHLHAHYERNDVDGHAVRIEAATDQNSEHSQIVGGARANEPASATGNPGKAKYDQRTRDGAGRV